NSTSGIWSTCVNYDPVTTPGGSQAYSGLAIVRYSADTQTIHIIFKNCYVFNQPITSVTQFSPVTFMINGVLAPKNPPMTLITSFDALPCDSIIPPDPIIAVGPDQIVVMANATIGIYDKATQVNL